MAEKITDDQLDDVIEWVKPLADRSSLAIYAFALMALTELRERRRVDRDLINARPRNARWAGGRRRK